MTSPPTVLSGDNKPAVARVLPQAAFHSCPSRNKEPPMSLKEEEFPAETPALLTTASDSMKTFEYVFPVNRSNTTVANGLGPSPPHLTTNVDLTNAHQQDDIRSGDSPSWSAGATNEPMNLLFLTIQHFLFDSPRNTEADEDDAFRRLPPPTPPNSPVMTRRGADFCSSSSSRRINLLAPVAGTRKL